MLNPSDGDFTNGQLGLKFHSDSPMLRGILDKAGPALGNVDGCIMPARSDNDTANNPHNPLYAIAAAGAAGGVVNLIGSRNSTSGGNSISPAMFIDNELRPTKVDRPSDVTGMVDVGNLTAILNDPVDLGGWQSYQAFPLHLQGQIPLKNVTEDAQDEGFIYLESLALDALGSIEEAQAPDIEAHARCADRQLSRALSERHGTVEGIHLIAGTAHDCRLRL